MSLQAYSSFQGGMQRDDRRRRLLAEDVSSGCVNPVYADASNDVSAADKAEPYSDGVFMEQMRLIDLVPRRLPILILWLIGGLAIIAGVNFLHGCQSSLTSLVPNGDFSAFDLTRQGSLCAWYSSLLLLAAAGAAGLVYSIRRHRTDDYRGRYRIWLWTVACLFFCATDVAINLHESFKQIMIHLAKIPLWGDGAIWWIILYGLVFGVLSARLLLDMRPCWLSMATFILAAASYLAAVVLELDLVRIEGAARAIMIKADAIMYGHLMLLVSIVLYARHVILDAEGFFLCQEGELATASSDLIQTNSTTAAGGWLRVDPPASMPQPTMLHSATTAPISSSTSASASFGSSGAPTTVTRKLTKQEKKSLRERLLSERLERQRQQGQAWK